MEELPVRRLHREAVPASDPEIEVNVRRREPMGTPPLRELAWLGAGVEDALAGTGKHALHPQGQRLAICHVAAPVNLRRATG
jgi:hypothetical protein